MSPGNQDTFTFHYYEHKKAYQKELPPKSICLIKILDRLSLENQQGRTRKKYTSSQMIKDIFPKKKNTKYKIKTRKDDTEYLFYNEPTQYYVNSNSVAMSNRHKYNCTYIVI